MSKKIIISTLAVALLVIFSGSSYERFTSSSYSNVPLANTPIQHIVIIMQENHAFDNMFGTFPGVPAGYSEDLSVCMPNNPPAATPCTKPWNADSKQATVQGQDIPHTRAAALEAYDSGAMNGFVKAMPSDAKTNTMAYYTGSVIPYYWDYASYFTLNYNFFSSAMSYSLPNHLFAVAAQAGSYASTCLSVCETEYNLTFPQIGETLTNAGIPWGYYQYNWNDAVDCPSTPYTRSFINAHGHTGGFDGLWSGLTDFTQVQMSITECHNLLNLKDFENAVKSNNLPSVAWVEPEPTVSDHPGQGTWANGQKYISSLINMIEASPEWSSTVIFLCWDDWGGYYDGITPPQFDAAGEGFRVPLIAISPYSIPGGIVEAPTYSYDSSYPSTHAEDFSAFLSTIEYNWGLSPLTVQDSNARDGHETNLFYMLDFNQAPLKPLILASTGVTYPLSSCKATACSYNAANVPANLNVYDPHVGINESVTLALAYSGDDDPGD
jgi:phospholipase C